VGIHQIYKLDAVGCKDELSRFWRQKIKYQGYSGRQVNT